jgi:hypothetical protein
VLHNQNGYPLEIHKQHKKEFLLLALFITSVFLTIQSNLPNNNLIASGDVGTQVGGTITNNTTWTAANSPYIITNTIQIPENVNLTIEPGVTVTTQSSITTMFLINGVIQANGNATSKIIFDGNGDSNFFKTNHPVAKGFVDLDYCIIRNGQSAFWFDNTGSFNLANSELSNLSQSSYLWYPSQDTFIEYNSFMNTAGIKIGTDDYFSNSSGMVFVNYNLFINNQGFIINNFASYGLSKTIVNNNSFTSTSGIILEVEKSSTTADLDASQNYWGTANTSIIDSMIYDKNDDVSCSSYINYLPILDAPDPDAPIAPTPPPSPTPTPTNTPEPTSLPTITPDPSSSPAPSTSPTTTPTPTPTLSPTNSPTPDPTSNPTPSPIANPSSNPNNADPNPNPSTTPAIPEFPPSIALLILLVTGSMGVIALKRKLK